MDEHGWTDKLFASTSLDHLIISKRADAWKSGSNLRVIPRNHSVELLLYLGGGLDERVVVSSDHLCDPLDRLLTRLEQSGQKP